jgi:hypothetical protein
MHALARLYIGFAGALSVGVFVEWGSVQDAISTSCRKSTQQMLLDTLMRPKGLKQKPM